MARKCTINVTDEEIIRLAKTSSTIIEAAQKAGMNYKTFWAKWKKLDKEIKKDNTEYKTTQQKKYIEKKLKTHIAANATYDEIRRIFKLGLPDMSSPEWVLKPPKHDSNKIIGVPSLMLSDIHYGEVVDPLQVTGLNCYNTEIAKKRLNEILRRAIDVLFYHMVNPNYPGFVLHLNGDLISGNIHQELIETNELLALESVRPLVSLLKEFIDNLLISFKNVFVVTTCGNHGRDTLKPYSKNNVKHSFDGLVSNWLETLYSGNKNIKFLNSPAIDCYFNIYNVRYRQTHGDQFSGGRGFQGAKAPIWRGYHKSILAAATTNRIYDTMLIGHFHEYNPGLKIISNGSLIGYNEFAHRNQYTYEEPRMALWITHPRRGITFHFGLDADNISTYSKNIEWISWEEYKNA